MRKQESACNYIYIYIYIYIHIKGGVERCSLHLLRVVAVSPILCGRCRFGSSCFPILLWCAAAFSSWVVLLSRLQLVGAAFSLSFVGGAAYPSPSRPLPIWAVVLSSLSSFGRWCFVPACMVLLSLFWIGAICVTQLNWAIESNLQGQSDLRYSPRKVPFLISAQPQKQNLQTARKIPGTIYNTGHFLMWCKMVQKASRHLLGGGVPVSKKQLMQCCVSLRRRET